MASVVRRAKSRFWTACYTARDGRQLKKSTKTTDRRAAVQIALDLERVQLNHLPRFGGGRQGGGTGRRRRRLSENLAGRGQRKYRADGRGVNT